MSEVGTSIVTNTRALDIQAGPRSSQTMHAPTQQPRMTRTSSAARLVAGLLVPAAVFAVLLANALTDGYFRDEFYYLACARRLAWG